MKMYKITVESTGGIRHDNIEAATLQAALGKALRAYFEFNLLPDDGLDGITIRWEWDVQPRKRLTDAEKIQRRIARDQAKLADLGGVQ